MQIKKFYRNLLASTLVVSGLIVATTDGAQAQTRSNKELLEMIQKQQKQINQLSKQLQTNEEKVELVATSLETSLVNNLKNISLGGYGEIHLNKGRTKDEVDVHRFVLFTGYKFSDSIRFYSELELEHTKAGEGENGAIELEQAYLEFDLNNVYKSRVGLDIIPIGIMNMVHEPPTFYGAERNPVETNIIPTTWREVGVSLNGTHQNGVSYNLFVHSGLSTPVSGSNSFKIRNGRANASEAPAEAGAVTATVKYTGVLGLEIAASGNYQQDITQGELTGNQNVDATLVSTHVKYQKNGFGFRALYARWDINSGLAKSFGRDVQYGYYIEPSYKFDVLKDKQLGFFARYNHYDNEAGDGNNEKTDIQQYDVGVNFWPHKKVVLKADVAFINGKTEADDDTILNLGAGFQF
ncbi:MAG: porin [Proteobacteria bacterium]|nr:porin [Pseudomonadota bacterium]